MSASHQPQERETIQRVLTDLAALQAISPSSSAQSAMTHDQALRAFDLGMWLVGYSNKIQVKTAKQSGKSVARKHALLSDSAI